ncbi:MAG: hypothetical protein Q9O62_11535 [Ardenticatenia bacterium]|nr:hypothetical protein [Ardenticatenia bacterium]
MGLMFRRERVTHRMLDPRQGFRPLEHTLEVRFDPLTGHSAHIAHLDAIRPVPISPSAFDAPSRRATCPFCPERREATTPRFPPSLLPQGRLQRGEALVVPNIAPYDLVSAVTIMTYRHLVPITDFTETHIADALAVTLDFLRRARNHLGQDTVALICWNYMPPSGGGLVHPHVQALLTHFPGNRLRAELEAARAYVRATGHVYWAALVDAERAAGERYIGCTGSAHWMAAFAPVGTLGEVLGIFPEVEDPHVLGTRFCRETARAFLRLFHFFHAWGVGSFNAALALAPAGWPGWRPCWRVVPRTYLNAEERPSDTNVFQVVLQEPVSSIVPEVLAERARPFFKGE